MTDNICRWGILSTAGIAKKNWESIRHSENATLVAVASRDANKAQAFIDDCQSQVPFPTAPRAIGSYEELLASDEIDAVYVPLPTALRKEWVIRAAQAGKHVLCEKPCATSTADLEEMIGACQSNNVQFMDGIMYMHSERLNAVRACLDDSESVGTIKRIASQFSFCAPPDFLAGDIRLHSDLEPAGCLGDLGWYTIRMALWTMDYTMPESVTAKLLSVADRPDSPRPVPTEFSAEMLFPGGVSATFYNSFLTDHQQWVNISGDKGHLTVRDFVLPFFANELTFETDAADFAVDSCKFNMERHTTTHHVPEYATNHPTAQETNLFRNFSALALSGTPDDHWSEASLKTQRILDACLKSAQNGGTPVTP